MISAKEQRDRTQRKLLEKYGKGNLIQCQICKRWFRQVGSHIVQLHGMTAREYREEYGFDVMRGQLPEDYRKLKAEHVFNNGTIENLKKGERHRFKKGQTVIYTRSKQTMDRLKKARKLYGKFGKI